MPLCNSAFFTGLTERRREKIWKTGKKLENGALPLLRLPTRGVDDLKRA
jgi:hypothetical protein